MQNSAPSGFFPPLRKNCFTVLWMWANFAYQSPKSKPLQGPRWQTLQGSHALSSALNAVIREMQFSSSAWQLTSKAQKLFLDIEKIKF